MGPQAVFVGVGTQDALALVSRYPAANERIVAEAITYAGGGPAATAAVAAARLGVSTAFIGVVGEDAEGERVLAGLRAEGVDVTGVTVDPQRATGASVVVVDRPAATRAIANLPAPVPVISTAAAELIERADWVHADHVGWASVAPLVAGPRAWRVSLDAGYAITGLDLSGVDLYVPTVDVLPEQLGVPDGPVGELIGQARQRGVGTVVATAAADGSFALSADDGLVHVPAARTEILSTLGAGDVFHGALVAAFVYGKSLRDALAYANTVAALSCRALDGRSGIPSHLEAEEFLAAHPLV